MAGMYRIGPTGLFTNDDLKADAATLNGQIDRLDDLPMETVTQAFFDAWWAFRGEWKSFYSGTILGGIFGPAWNDSNRDQLIQFETRFADFATQYAAQTKTEVPDVVNPSNGPADGFGDLLGKQIKPLLVVADNYKWLLLGGAALFLFREPIISAVKQVVGKVSGK